jgi:hypothetical protein
LKGNERLFQRRLGRRRSIANKSTCGETKPWFSTAGATSITLELKNLKLRGKDDVWAAGSYSVTVKDETIQGNWLES